MNNQDYESLRDHIDGIIEALDSIKYNLESLKCFCYPEDDDLEEEDE